MDPCLPSRFIRFVLPASCAFATLICLAGRASAAERIKISADAVTSPSITSSARPGGEFRQSPAATTTWLQYPGACSDRYAGTWAGRSTPQADSLNTYTPGGTGPYTVVDQSLREILWHVSDNATCTPGVTCPPALVGSRMLWCGKFDANWVVQYGYSNFTYQILYLDTGTHAGNYDLTVTYNFSGESYYDHAYLIGGGDGATDPIGNNRGVLDNIIADGSSGNARLLVGWTGSVSPGTPNATGGNTTGGTVQIQGSPSGPPTTVVGASFTIEAQHRALYLVFRSDCFVSSEDGLSPDGHGPQFDNISTSDNGSLYTDEAPSGGVDAFSGNVIKGTSGAPVISARVPPGVGTFWQLVSGNNLPTPDVCSPKNLSTDLMFMGGNGTTFHTVPNEATAFVSCTFPVPAGTASVIAQWSQYLDMPAYQGYVQFAEYRYFRDGLWSTWRSTDGGGTRRVGAIQAWGSVRSELAEAARADSVQLRYSIRCVPETAADLQNCGDVIYGLLYDDLRLEVVSGVPAPVFGIYPAFLAQSTFVDGSMGGVGCSGGTVAAHECWPGVRGSDNGQPSAVHDNFNSPLGDSVVLSIGSGLRRNGKGLNWHHGFDKSVNAGLTIAHTNPNFISLYDKPRVIYRLFDPASKTWSPFDSSELDANGVAVGGSDTVLIDSKFRMNWPPRDKVGMVLPGGFTINGQGSYSALRFLPRGTRLQYYFKGVDINGGKTYQFGSDLRALEVEDLPILPGGSIRAPDIIEFDVLPGAYAPGAGGTLLAGRTDTPILNLDGVHTAWGSSADPVTQALRALGVRADRYRLLQGTEQGSNVGGHEFAGTRPGRLGNYFPNMDEYGIKDSLAAWYRIMIESSHVRASFVLEESDSKLINQWWSTPTPGTDGGDRCLLSTGNDFFAALLAVGGVPHPNNNALATQVFGVAAAVNQWNGGASNQFPLIKDMFADPAAGPGLGVSGAYSYIVDGGCPMGDRFDALTKIGTADAQNSATYPTFGGATNTAAVAHSAERDVIPDHDRNKAVGYGFSIQLIRQGGMNMVDTRAQVLYKFLTSCRGPRTTTDTASCWPCPTDANKYGNWATLTGFQTGTYGPLYRIQDHTKVLTGTGEPGPETPRFINALSQNRPNPFNPETIISYSLAARGKVAIRIYDVSGRRVRTLVDAVKDPGVYQARWTGELDSGGKAASSIYFYKITYPDGTSSAKKMAILR
ncbi:MAG TPA: T9SS type A sorting domain-containing protein [Candidatus Eisenbacteria bacterium]|jgi:hypothetical protein